MDSGSGTAPVKPWWQSKTIIGAAVTGIAIVAGFFGISIDDQTKSVLIDQTDALMVAGAALAGTALTIYGRVVASKKIG